MKRIIFSLLLSFTLPFLYASIAQAANFSMLTSTATETTVQVTAKAAAPLEVHGATLYLKQGIQLIQYSSTYNQLEGNNTIKKTFTGLTKATTYQVYVEWINASFEKQSPELLGTVTTKGTAAVTPQPANPTTTIPVTNEVLSVESLTTSAGIHITFNGDTKKTYSVVYYLAENETMLNPTVKRVEAILNSQDSLFYSGASFTKLSPGKTYYAQAEVFDGYVGKKTPIQTVTTKAPSATANGYTYQPRDTSFDLRGYTVLAPIPGFPTIFPSAENCAAHPEIEYCNFGDYLNLVIELAIALAAVMLVIKLVIHGYTYMTQDVPFMKLQAKTKIGESLIGILLALTAYLILNTINPRLVSNNVTLEKAVLTVQTEIDSGTFQQLTGETLKTKSDYIPLVEKISKDMGIDSCIVKATIQVESNWKANAIGCDEEVASTDVPSRIAFTGSGVKYDGSKFTPTKAGEPVKNGVCKFSKDKPGYGLDWRFSKGGGLMQKTIFPQGYKSASWYAGVKEGGSYWNTRTTPYSGWEKLLKPEENIKAGIAILKSGLSACNGSIEKIFRYYQTGSCNGNGPLVRATVAKKMSIYNSCK